MSNELRTKNHVKEFFVFCFLLFVFCSPKAYAQEFSLSISPPRIVIQTEAPTHTTKEIQLTNKTDQSINLDINFKPFTQSESKNGKVSYKGDKDLFFEKDIDIFEKIHVYDNDTQINSITLSPKQTKTITLHIDFDDKEPNKDYYFSVLFISKNIETNDTPSKDKIRAYTNIQPAIATNVLLSVFTGKKEPQGTIETYYAPLFKQNGPTSFYIDFKNTGEHLLVPEGTIIIRNMFGQAIGKLTIPKTFVLANTIRTITVDWPEKFLLGPYTAELILTTADDKTVFFKRSTWFIGTPINILAGIIVLIIAMILLQKRVSRRLSQ